VGLTDTFVKQVKPVKKAGDKYADGGGMYLLVKEAGKYWHWRMDYRHLGLRKTHKTDKPREATNAAHRGTNICQGNLDSRDVQTSALGPRTARWRTGAIDPLLPVGSTSGMSAVQRKVVIHQCIKFNWPFQLKNRYLQSYALILKRRAAQLDVEDRLSWETSGPCGSNTAFT
jgi:hypothetical protein